MHRKHFTLIELLVVIAIIGVLAAMLLPALSKARDKVRRVACMGQVKQMNLAAFTYADDNELFVPGCSQEGYGPGGWAQSMVDSSASPRFIAPQVLWTNNYIGKNDTALMLCPSRVDRPMIGNTNEGLTWVGAKYYKTYYSCYSWLGSAAISTFGSSGWGSGIYWVRLDLHSKTDMPLLCDMTSYEPAHDGGWLWMRKSSHFNGATNMPYGGNVGAIDGSCYWLDIGPYGTYGNMPFWDVNWQEVLVPKGSGQPNRNSSYFFTNPGSAPTGAKRGNFTPPA